MEFENEMAELEEALEIDQELLQIQRRKSTPKVVIEEFVPASDEEMDDEAESPSKAHKVKTHYEIDDVSSH